MNREKITEVASVLLVAVLVFLIGSMYSYPPYARLLAFLLLLLGFGLLALREEEVERVGEESLEGKPGKSSEPSAEDRGEVKGKEEERKGKKSGRSKAKRKKKG